MALNDLNQMFSIVDPNTGKPTDYLMRLLRDRGVEVNNVEELVQLLEQNVNLLDAIVQTINGTVISAGTGLGGGGTIGVDDPITLALNAGINDLTDVDTATTPPTVGQALVWDDISSLWVPGDVASGGGGGVSGNYLGLDEFAGAVTRSLGAGFYIGRLVVADSSRTVESVKTFVRTANGTSRITPAIYSVNSNGTINTLVAQGPTVVGATAGIMTLPLTTPLAVTEGTLLYVGFILRIANLDSCSSYAEGAVFFGAASDVPAVSPAGATYGVQSNWFPVWAGLAPASSGGGGGGGSVSNALVVRKTANQLITGGGGWQEVTFDATPDFDSTGGIYDGSSRFTVPAGAAAMEVNFRCNWENTSLGTGRYVRLNNVTASTDWGLDIRTDLNEAGQTLNSGVIPVTPGDAYRILANTGGGNVNMSGTGFGGGANLTVRYYDSYGNLVGGVGGGWSEIPFTAPSLPSSTIDLSFPGFDDVIIIIDALTMSVSSFPIFRVKNGATVFSGATDYFTASISGTSEASGDSSGPAFADGATTSHRGMIRLNCAAQSGRTVFDMYVGTPPSTAVTRAGYTLAGVHDGAQLVANAGNITALSLSMYGR